MKRILITGKNSYIGNSFKKWVSKWPDKYRTYSISVRGDEWRKHDFSQYDVLLHCAGIVHKKENKKFRNLFFNVNRDLTVKLAKKAKDSGVKQFIFMSTISVYGLHGDLYNKTVIDEKTKYNPNTFYGESKLEAELELIKLNDENFKVVIVRPPMVYGPDCPGNYKKLRKLALIAPIFPLISNQRSMIFIDNLTEFLKQIIDNQDSGIYLPQNNSYINTIELVELIAKINNKNIFFSETLGKILLRLGKKNKTINKVFGNLVIDRELSKYQNNSYCIFDFVSSIKVSEKDNGVSS